MSLSDYPMDLGEYWTVLRRRRWYFVLPFLFVMAVSAAIAFLLPATYRSEAKIMVERQNIPSTLVATTVTSYVQEQIEQIRQDIVTYQNLLDLAERHELYEQTRETDPRSVVQDMASKIEVTMVDVNVADPDESGKRYATVAFTVAFSAEDPQAARAVTHDISQRYLELHKQAREQQAAEVSEFLKQEASGLETEIMELEKLLASFKQDELRQLPELMDLNLRMYDKTEEDIDTARDQVRAHQERIDALQSELSLTSPYSSVLGEDGRRILTGAERLSVLTAEYLQASANYSAEHPDVKRLRREISLLAGEWDGSARVNELMSDLVTLQEQLRRARQKYTDAHPEVQKLERAVAAVQAGFGAALGQASTNSTSPALPPDNPRYVSLKTQLDAAEANLKAEQQSLEGLLAKLSEYEERLFQTPIVERDYKTLSRDYDNTVKKYQELKESQLKARLAEKLESGENAERWVLIGQAYAPVMPESPNRLGIGLLGFLLAFASGLGGVGVGEYSDRTVRGSRMVSSIMGVGPLTVIPDLRTRAA